jgi:hypothetical protein
MINMNSMLSINKINCMEFGLEARMTFAKLQPREESPSSLKRRAKIFGNKLPQDFFGNRIFSHSEHKKQNPYR